VTGESHQLVQIIADYASQVPPNWRGSARFVLRIGEEFAFIRMADLWRPLRFLRQMAGAPPVQFGVQGFDPALVDDHNPVRHYIAFVVVGFWLPAALAWLTLIGWEGLGFLRYGGKWSQSDMLLGQIGLRHGRNVRRQGARILPGLIEKDLLIKNK
jgi:hypothetical protein